MKKIKKAELQFKMGQSHLSLIENFREDILEQALAYLGEKPLR